MAIVAILLLGGCASHRDPKGNAASNRCQQAQNPKPNSYLDDWDRANFQIDLPLFKYILKPIGRTYKNVTPAFLQARIRDFVNNLDDIAVIANDILQARGRPALRTTGRFVTNSTIGLLGSFDVASKLGLKPQAVHEDFGLTLADWGVPEGPYLVLPVVGPTTARNSLSLVTDGYLFDPLTYVNHHNRAVDIIHALEFLNTAGNNLNNIDEMLNAIDPYVFTQQAYLQHRRFLVQQNGGPSQSSSSIDCYLNP